MSYIAQYGAIALVNPPAQTNAGSDTPLTFAQETFQVTVQNNSSIVVNVAYETAASAGSFALQPGSTLVELKKCSVLHLYTASSVNINGTTAGNIVVLGEGIA